jgi:hypothetical protein
MLNPRSWKTLTALSGVYLRLEAPEVAAQTLEQARLIQPHDANILVTLGAIYRKEREYELAREAYRQALTAEPDLTAAAIGLGSSCIDLGEYAEAAEVLEGLIKRGLCLLDTVQELASLPASVVSVDLLAELDKVVREPGQDQAQFTNLTAFVRARALDKLGRYAEAWEHLVPANRAVFLSSKEEFAAAAARQRASVAMLRSHPIRSFGDPGAKTGEPISLFILGPSRSGKTTMETLVSTLEGVKRGYENPAWKTRCAGHFKQPASSPVLVPNTSHRSCIRNVASFISRNFPVGPDRRRSSPTPTRLASVTPLSWPAPSRRYASYSSSGTWKTLFCGCIRSDTAAETSMHTT